MNSAPFGRMVVGTVAAVSAASFTITMGTGQTLTVSKRPGTTYWKAGSLASARAVTRGTRVAVLATPHGSTISATAVAVLPGHVWS
jgi:hypothetical protein